MNKLIYSLLAAGLMFAATSCSSDEPAPGRPSSDGLLDISVNLPVFSTRAIGDTLNCNQLIYTVYDSTGATVIMQDTVDNVFGQGVTSSKVNIQLVKGETYKIAFYAHNTGSEFSSYNEGNIKVDYTKINPNLELDDAFYKVTDLTVTGEAQSVTLGRAFAQINIGTTDMQNPAVIPVLNDKKISTTLSIANGLYTSMDIMGETPVVSNEEGAAQPTLTATTTAVRNENFPVSGVGNLTSVYILVGPEESMVNATYSIKNGNTEIRNINLASTPVCKNFRTNIYGNLITTDVEVIVNLEPEFDGVYDDSVWDGEKVSDPVIDETNKTVSINTAAQFAGFAQLVNSGNNTLENYTVTLSSDIDLNNKPWTPIGNLSQETGSSGTLMFAGTFDGQGHTISNVNCTVTGDKASAGIFGRLCGVVKNLNVKNVNITSDHYAGGISGYTYINGYSQTPPQAGIIGCTVNGGTITSNPTTDGNEWDNGDKVGGLTGYTAQGRVEFSDNTVSNLTITAYRDLGSLIGYISNPPDAPDHNIYGSGNKAINVKLIQNLTHNYKNLTEGQRVGELIGHVEMPGFGYPEGTAENVTISSITE